MLFNSPLFIFAFLPFVVLVYFALTRNGNAFLAKCWLVAASLFFYGYWNPVYLILIIGSIAFNYLVSLKIFKSDDGLPILVFGIVCNVGLLGWFKYVDFAIANMNWVAGADIPFLNLALPLAISFFTFQQIAYLVDTYQKKLVPANFLDYSLFVTFFPQLIAGPIVHHSEMMPQFSASKRGIVNWGNISNGTILFCIGLFKKIVVADTFSKWAIEGYAGVGPMTFSDAWTTSLSYTMQIYYDFSGYTDMAIGAALALNIKLPKNFNSPYQARNIQDFWRRWHMTLSRWLRDYIYIPLGGNRVSNPRIYINLFATFLVGGLWHGAAWTFVAWGALHGSAIVIHRWWSEIGGRMPGWLAWAITLMFVHLTWIFFRAETFDGALRVMRGLVAFDTVSLPVEADKKMIEILAYLITFSLVALFAKNSQHQVLGDSFVKIRYAFLCSLTLFYAIVASAQTVPSEFLYFNF